MENENEQEMKIAKVLQGDLRVECPYCGQAQVTFRGEGDVDTCCCCEKDFEIGEVKHYG